MVFGGLIGHIGKIEQITSHRLCAQLPSAMMESAELGDSIATNGVCLTVAEMDKEAGTVMFDLSDETLAKTTLGSPPDQAHLEPALRLSDAVGGHVLSGHVHGVAKLASLNRQTGDLFIDLADFMAKGYSITGALPILKDSIAIDGVSLTVAEVLKEKQMIRIALIEHTMKKTLFPGYSKNQPVNIEYHTIVDSSNVTAKNDALGALEERDDTYWMSQAVVEAEKGRYTAPPNPWVGAILVDQWNRKIAAGHHKRPGDRHAERMIEVDTMEDCTLYVTLEPCSHHGRTPPCIDYVIEKKPRRVVVGILDPDTRVSGRGVTALRKAGIKVEVGVASEVVSKSLRPYLWHRTHNQTPYVLGKLAVSMDNCYAYCTDTNTNRSWITGEHARRHGHGERASSQRIVVGKNTAEMDQPKLNVRYDYQVDRQPEAVVSTRELNWMREGDANTLQVMVEGGPELHDNLLHKGNIQEFVLYRSTRLLGLAGVRWMPSFLDDGWKLVETKTFEDGDTMQRFLHNSVVTLLEDQVSISQEEDLSKIASRSTTPRPMEAKFQFDTIEKAIVTLKEGGLIVVMDDEDRENEGDLMMLADRISLRNMKLMLTHTTGIVCATITKTRANLLNLPPMIPDSMNTDAHCTKFTVTVDAAKGTTTGVSAADRMQTLSVLADPSSVPSDLLRPGHIFPLVAAAGGLLERQGHTEAGVELARLAGMEQPCMVISELYDQATGKMMSRSQCAQLGLPIITVAALREYTKPKWASVPLQNVAGNWEVATFSGTRVVRLNAERTDVLDASKKSPLLVRVHSECFTGDFLGSALCDCGNQLQKTLQLIQANGEGMVLFPPEHEGRGIGLENKMKAYKLQKEKQLNTFEANEALGYPQDARDFSGALAALKEMNVTPQNTTIRLLSENPSKLHLFQKAGFEASFATLEIDASAETAKFGKYLEDKRAKFNEQGKALGVERNQGKPATTTSTASDGGEGGVSKSSGQKATAQEGNTSSSATAPPLSGPTTGATTHASFKESSYGLSKMAPPALNLSENQLQAMKGFKVCFVQAEWHRHLSDPLVDSMTKTLAENYGITSTERKFASGSFELPRVIQHLSRSKNRLRSRTIFIAIGILVKGETDHYDLVAKESTAGIARIQLDDSLWVINAILGCHNIQQAADRCLPDGPAFVGDNMAQAVARTALTVLEEDDDE